MVMYYGLGFTLHSRPSYAGPSCTAVVSHGTVRLLLCHLFTHRLTNTGFICEQKLPISCPR